MSFHINLLKGVSMQVLSKNKIFFLLLAAAGLTACQNPGTTTANGNQTNISNVPVVGNVNVVTNTNSITSNGNVLTGEGTGIEAREPEQYQAQISLKLETGGTQKSASMPPLTAQVARSGNDKRMEFALPNGDKVVYLSRGAQQFVIFPKTKQYAELNKEALGVDIRQLMTPEQLVKQVKNIKGVERVGEEKLGDRDVIRYRYGGTTQVNAQPAANTQTKANVSTDAAVLVDKETGLPLRSETFVESQGGAVNGMDRLRVVTEMSNLQMTADPSLFAEPTDFKKVAPEEVRSQIDMLMKMAGALVQQLLSNQQGAGNQQPPTLNAPSSSPAAKP
jgi:hypothetical protein